MLINFFTLLIHKFWILLKEISLWILLGSLLSSILKIFISKNTFFSYFGKSNIYSVIRSSLLGIPLPLCSCGVIPIAQSLNKDNNISKGSIASFLISTPQTGIDSLITTYGFLGFNFAVIRFFVALFSGIFGGIMVNFFIKSSSKMTSKLDVDCNCNNSNNIKMNKIFFIIYNGYIEMIKDLGKWILLGLFFASLFSIFFSDHVINQVLNHSWKEFLVISVMSIPLYICATGSIPISLVLISKGISPGAILIFLLLGPATNITTIIILIKNFGKKFTLIYLMSLIISSIFFAIIINKYLMHIIIINKINYISSICNNLNLFKILSSIFLLCVIFFPNFFINKKYIKY